MQLIKCSLKGIAIYRGFLDYSTCYYLLEYLKSINVSYVETKAKDFSVVRAYHEGNEGNEDVEYLINTLYSLGIDNYIKFDDITIIKYRNGRDEIPFHVDGDHFRKPNTSVGTISLGGDKVFQLRKINSTKIKESLTLVSGDIMVMDPEVQLEYEHRVPQSDNDQERYTIYLFQRRKNATN